MRRFNLAKLNWKYVIGEVLLIFIGINLAIWFNNWNTSRTRNADKEIALQKIEEEVSNNLEELVNAREANYSVKEAIDAYRKMQVSGLGTVATSEEITQFQKDYPRFFRVQDSVLHQGKKYIYDGDTFINLELMELTEIAWETSKTTGITGAFGYECLYLLEGMYNVQKLVQNEVTKAANALQEGDIKRLLRVLEFMEQLDAQLERDYNSVLENIRNCD
ncbi:hypothetical protein [Poritiphilus flavus]|uniref:Uncharacterized protein n=1 Tax=Poritiphilus flavus TaxID=2697053 RepID=A0A6L9EIM8_9FLAO|nr:hypothetical protein [Poritiphilus flavus]NAS14368.1 hypothetical protein [Poritiphilus flavus]